MKYNSPTYITTVNNDAQGLKIIQDLKRVLNCPLRLRGRHNNRKSALGDKYRRGSENAIPLSLAQKIAIYFRNYDDFKKIYF